MEVLKYRWVQDTSNMQCNYNSFIQLINFHGFFRNALRCWKTGACWILVPLRYTIFKMTSGQEVDYPCPIYDHNLFLSHCIHTTLVIPCKISLEVMWMTRKGMSMMIIVRVCIHGTGQWEDHSKLILITPWLTSEGSPGFIEGGGGGGGPQHVRTPLKGWSH